MTPGIFNIDAHRDTLAIAAFNGETKRQRDFMVAAGMTGSAWEHLIHEGFFNTQAASAVKLLKVATQQGIPVFHINQSNAREIVPQLQLPSDDLADIINALNSGASVAVSKTPVQLGNYIGTGYIMLDPITASGPYYLSGGLAGGVTFSLEEWKREVYGRTWASLTVRNFVMSWAKSKIGTPYGLGCKEKFVTGTDQVGRCADDFGPYSIRIDCSGLVEFAYYMVGFPYFAGKNAQGQFNFVRDNFTLPSASSVLFGDIVFFDNTYDKNNNGIRTDDGVTHVGIVDKPQRWIAAEGAMVAAYCTASYLLEHPSDDCFLTNVWPSRYGTFYSYGSVIRGK